VILFCRILLLMFLISTVSFSQTTRDTVRGGKEIQERGSQINRNAGRVVSKELKLFNNYFSIPLNPKIYQKILVNDFLRSHTFSQEELRTGMTGEELAAFEKHKLNTQRILSDIYGEDLIDVESILSALGITREQIIAVAAILKFFLM